MKQFDDKVIRPMKDALISAAFTIINSSNYGYDEENMMDTSDVSVLYPVFDLFDYSITVTGVDPQKFEKSLRYRASMDDRPYDCLLGFKDIQARLI